MIVNLIDYLKDRLRMVICSCTIGIVAIVVWSLTVDTHHAHSWAEMHIPAFWSLFGFCACIVIIFLARWLGKCGIKIREDYYDK